MCNLLQQARFWTQNPPALAAMGVRPPPGTNKSTTYADFAIRVISPTALMIPMVLLCSGDVSRAKMPRKSQQRVTAVWEKVPCRGGWRIRYRVDGQLKREKTDRKSDAIALYQQRKSEMRGAKKLPANVGSAGIRFKEPADAILTYSAARHRDTKSVRIRLAKITADFGDREAETVKPEKIDAWHTARCKTPATANRYRALFSLVYREALRNRKVNRAA